MSKESKVSQIVAEYLGISAVNICMDDTLVDDLGADSLDCVEIVMGLEDYFQIDIDDESLPTPLKVNDLVAAVEAKTRRVARG